MLNIGINEDIEKKSTWHFIPAFFVTQSQEGIQNAKVSNYF